MILKPTTTLNGPAAFHVLKKIESLRPFQAFTLSVDSYADEATYRAGGNQIVRHTPLMPAAAMSEDPEAAAEVWLTSDPSSPFVGGMVVADAMAPLDVAQAHKVVELNAACQASIYGGFDSDALGEVHRYGADPQDQANLVASVLDSKLDNPEGWMTAFKCAGPDGVREYKMHTAAQIQQVGKDGKASITACLLKNEGKIAQVRTAESIDAVNAVNWSTP